MFVVGLFKQQEFMKSTPTSPSSRAEMYVRQATPDTYREVLKDIRQKEIYKLIIDTNSQHMSKFFRAVSRMYHIIFNLETFLGKQMKNCFSSINLYQYENIFILN